MATETFALHRVTPWLPHQAAHHQMIGEQFIRLYKVCRGAGAVSRLKNALRHL